jgi:hypothetical protein
MPQDGGGDRATRLGDSRAAAAVLLLPGGTWWFLVTPRRAAQASSGSSRSRPRVSGIRTAVTRLTSMIAVM